MAIKRLNPSARLSQAVVYNDTVYLAGQAGDPSGDIEEQTREALAKVEELLSQCGSGKSKILQVTIWLAQMSDFDAMNRVYDAWIDPEHPPTRACGESALAKTDFLFEIIVVAAR